MIALLQKVLQLYACEQLGQPQQGGGGGGGDGLVDELLAADEGQWARLIRQRSADGNVRWAPGLLMCGCCFHTCQELSCLATWLLLHQAPGSAPLPLRLATPSRHPTWLHHTCTPRLLCLPCCCCSEAGFMEALQRRMESVVLGLPSGSYAQRVQAEYLKELEERAKGAFAELAKEA
jgi:hypothetical protein